MKRLNELEEMKSDIERLWTEPGGEQVDRTHVLRTPSTLTHELDRLQASNDELEMSLKKATSRIDRLSGEKKQLVSLLEKRDEQIERLSRELGGYTSVRRGVAVTSHFSGSVMAKFVALMKRIGTSVAERHLSTEELPSGQQGLEEQAGDTTGPLKSRRLGSGVEKVVVALMFGLDRDAVKKLLPLVQRDCASRGLTPLYLVDTDAFELFRERGLIFEYLPPADDQTGFDASLQWDLYVQRRLALIRKKWSPSRIISFGETATKTLSLWSSSPFEDTPLPAAISESLAVE